MRFVALFFTLVILAFAGTMNTLLVLRQNRLMELGKYRQSVQTYFGAEQTRERWMGIYRNNNKIGYTGVTMERIPIADEDFAFQFWSSLDSVFTFDLFGRGKHVAFRGNLMQDNAMRPLELRGKLTLDHSIEISFSGKRDGDRFRLTVRKGDLRLFERELPLEDFHLGDGLTPTLPLAGLEVGDTFQVASFDPILMGRSTVNVEVLSSETRPLGGILVDVFALKSLFRGASSTSWVTRDGTLLRQEFGPPLEGVVLKRENKQRAQKGFR